MTAKKKWKMTERRFEAGLMNVLARCSKVSRTETFANAGILTNNKGLVVRMADGTKFQLTIVEDRRGW